MIEILSDTSKLEEAAQACAKLGIDAIKNKDFLKALVSLQKAVEFLEELTNQLSKQKQSIQNLSELKSELNEKLIYVLSTLANDYWSKNDYYAAISFFEELIKVSPENSNVYNNLGFLYQELEGKYNNLDRQIEYFEKAYELNQNDPKIIRNLALTYSLVDKCEQASEYFQKLFKLNPELDDYIAYAYLKIQMGDLKEGWKYYENRFKRLNSSINYPKMPKPKWKGEKITNSTLLVHFEQGYGDSIQFCRYIKIIKPLAKKIIFRVQDSLVDLMKLNFKDVEVVGMSTELETLKFDYHIPLLSILNVIDATIENIPEAQGYLKADSKKVEYYKKTFFNNNAIKIGISWNGAKFGNRRRNIPLEMFYPLAKIKNVKLYSFQKNFGSEKLLEVPENIEIVDLGKTFDDFSDTAAAMENLDYFVTSDNGVFNLAAAMGKKTFLMLNKYSEWRWFFDEEKTPWYDTVKIFKKKNETDSWSILIQKVIENIK